MKIGLGCGPLGSLPEREAVALVHAALELGVTVFDTAPSYAASEAHLGRALARCRDRAVIVTKGGYGVEGVPDWTPACVARGVDRALGVLGTDWIDVFLLHSCPRATLERGDLLAPLVDAKRAGKVRAIGYSGDEAALAWAVACDDFDVIECSLNLFDQRALGSAIPEAARRGKRVLAKRALGGAPWRERSRPARPDAAVYWDRMRALFGDERALGELAVRFAAHADGVSAALVGTGSAAHLAEAVGAAASGPHPRSGEVRARFAAHAGDLDGVV